MLFSKPNLNNCQSLLMSLNLVQAFGTWRWHCIKAASGQHSQNKQERQTVLVTATPDLADIVESYTNGRIKNTM